MDSASKGDTQAHRPSEQDLLRQYLADRDVACPVCKYNIRQLKGNTCPECGSGLFLTVGATGLSNKWITALVASLIPAGCGIPFYLLFVIAISQGAPMDEVISELISEPEGIVFLLLVLYSLSCVVSSILLLVMRQRFVCLSPRAQSGISTTLVLSVVFAAMVGLGLIGSLF